MSEFKYMFSISVVMVVLVCYTIAYFYTNEFNYLIVAFCALIYGEIIDIKHKIFK
jgi:hypothetical protein